MEAIVDAKGNPVKDSTGHPLVKTPSHRVELLYTYLMTWYVIYCPSLITTVYLRRFCTFRAAVGELELAIVLHVLHPEDYSEWDQLPFMNK